MSLFSVILISFTIFSLSEILTFKLEKYLINNYPDKFKWLENNDKSVYNDSEED